MKTILCAFLSCLVAAQDYDYSYSPFSYYTYFPNNNVFQQNRFINNNFQDQSQDAFYGAARNFQNQPQESLYEDSSYEPLNLPSGASYILGDISSSFSCSERPYGYYADVDNFCRVYHICNPQTFGDGTVQTYQYSFMCGEGMVFDQRLQTCERETLSTPCSDAPNYYFTNSQYGLPHEKQRMI